MTGITAFFAEHDKRRNFTRVSHKFLYNGHEADLDLPRLPQRIKDSDKLWAEGAKPINVMGYILFHI